MESQQINPTKVKEELDGLKEKFWSSTTKADREINFLKFSNTVDSLISLEDPPKQIDDLIYDCVVSAKKMRKEMHPTSIKTNSLISSLFEEFASHSDPGLKWKDIAGRKPHRELFLRNLILPAKQKTFDKMSKTILLYGAPGNGKTAMAAAMAYETGFTYYHVNLMNLLPRSCLTHWKEIMETLKSEAEKNKPAVITIDEFEKLYPGNNDVDVSSDINVILLKEYLWEWLREVESQVKPSELCIIINMQTPWVLDLESEFKFFKLRIILDVPPQETRVLFIKNKLKEMSIEADNDDLEKLGEICKG